ALLVPFALLGLVVLRRRRRPGLLPILAPVAMVTITAMTTYGEIRFRAAAEASIVIAAAVAVEAWMRRRSAPAPLVSGPVQIDEPVGVSTTPVGVHGAPGIAPSASGAATRVPTA